MAGGARMKKIIDYKVILEDSALIELEKEVKKLIGVGWQPLGGICVNQSQALQAMVKFQDD